MFHCSYNRAGGGEGGRKGDKCQHSTGFWYIGFGCGWWESLEQRGGRARDVFVMQGAWKTKRSRDKVFVLTAVMHGVAGDDHR